MQVRISVIVPVFNTEKYIRPALDSLLNQTVKFHEIIVINDGSTDSSYEILREYESAGKIKLLSQHNQGQGAARNKGVESAMGNYIYFFDSDDLASPVLVETIQHEFESCNNLDIIAFAGDVFLDAGCDQLGFTPKYDRPIVGKFRHFFDAALAMDCRQSNHCSPCLFVIRKDVIEKNNFRFNIYYHEDDAFLLDLMASVGYCLILDDRLFKRRIRAGSTMTSKKTSSHVKGYLYASAIAQQYARKTDSSEGQDYFSKKAIQYYMQAVSISYMVDDFKYYNNIFRRILEIPNGKLTFRQFISLMGGRNIFRLKRYLIKISHFGLR